jgi:hypothetical protein
LSGASPALAAPGNLKTTEADCTTTNANIYATKDAVYLSGSNWTENARFYVRVYEPGALANTHGALLGDDATTSTDTIDANGDIPCDQLVTLVTQHSSPGTPGFDSSTVSHGPLGNEYQVSVSTDSDFASDKTDNFKVVTGCTLDCGGQPPAASLTVTKSVATSLTRTTTWGVDKSATSGAERDVAAGTDATFGYKVDVTHSSQDSAWTATGTITITNGGTGAASGTQVTDAINDANSNCVVDTTGFDGTVAALGTQTLPYTCTYTHAPASAAQSNTVSISWTNADTTTGTGSDTEPVDWTAAVVTAVDDSVTVSDPFMTPTTSTTVSASDPSPTTLTYSHTFSGDTAGTCTNHDNTASFVTNTTSTPGSDTQTVKVCVGANLSVAKTAGAKFTRTYLWAIRKTADKTLIEKAGGGTTSAAFHVKVDETGYTDSGWTVSGKITVTNPNDWESITADVSDSIDNNGTCTVTGGTAVTVAASGSKVLDYSCSYSSAPTPSSGTNTGTATWNATTANTPAGTASGTAGYAFGDPTTRVNQTVHVTDAFNGGTAAALTGGTLTASDNKSALTTANLPYSQTVNVPANDCVTYSNRATITETTQYDTATVEVCGPAKTGALTIGYWQNKNGQGIITGGASHGSPAVCNSGTWLRTFAPFQDLGATANCAAVATYVTNIIKAASAAGTTMNPMLKAQMLATALDVYFSDPALGTNKIAAPAPIGGVKVDLTMICKISDGSSGTGTCGGVYRDTSSAFGGAVLPTVLQLLTSAAGQSNAGGTTWYGQNKATQELAKDTFDAINNQLVFSP